MKFEIKHRFTGEILFSVKAESLKMAVEMAIKSQANLSRANLFQANLSRANLSQANLFQANLSQANLSRADLFRANLSQANLSRANLSRADLFQANLSRANLSRANLSRADLFQANLSRAKHGIPIESYSIAIRLNLLGVSLSAELFTTLYNGICWDEVKKLKISRKLLTQIKRVWPELAEEYLKRIKK